MPKKMAAAKAPVKEHKQETVEAEKGSSEPAVLKPLAITAKQFARARGIRWERAAGFLYYAGQRFGPNHRLPVAQWITVWDTWWQQPAGQPIQREEV